jgi:hypothetical protein
MSGWRAVAVAVWALGLALARVGEAEVAPDGGAQAPGAMQAEAGLRLSGIVTVAGEPRYAVVEAPGGDGRLVQAGDTLPDGSQVLAIGPDWVRLSARGQERLLHIVGLPADTSPASAGRPKPAPVAGQDAAAPPRVSAVDPAEGGSSHRGLLVVDGWLADRIARVAASKRRSAQVLADVIGDHLGLPSDTAIAVTDLGFRPFGSAAEAKAALDQGQMLRVQIGSGEEQQMLYLQSPQDAPPAAGGAHD